ncbi:TIGR04255 family protein [Alienimonas sp. DA493]|uniref:TIGR04255 family protein n=1 Tax=Alienimonas sp. DA493 TaxID=3373605 RepID=UPI003754EC73
MKLRNPPLVEAWIDFRFETPPAPPDPTGAERAERLLRKHFGEELPQVEHLVEDLFEFKPPRPEARPSLTVSQRTVAVRAANHAGTSVVQMGPNFASAHFVRADGADYPGFPALRDRALEVLRLHMEEFGESDPPGRCLRAFGLHNIDVVDVPREPDGSADLSSWFEFDVRVPSVGVGDPPFRVAARCESTTPVEDVRLTFSFESQDAPADAGARFRLEWHLDGSAGGEGPAGPETVRPRLDAAHAYLNTVFRAAFTDAMWARFSPADA